MVTCPHCGFAKVPEESVFCPSCGKLQQQIHCPKCGEKLVEGAQFCHKCGATIKAASPAAPPAPQRPPAPMPQQAPASFERYDEQPITITNPEESYSRPLTPSEMERIENSTAGDKSITRVLGAVVIGWGLIAFYAPNGELDPTAYSIIGFSIILVGMISGQSLIYKRIAIKAAKRSARAVEYTGMLRTSKKLSIDMAGGGLTFLTRGTPKQLKEYADSRGRYAKVVFTEGGSETKSGGEVFLLSINGKEVNPPVWGKVEPVDASASSGGRKY